MRDPETLRIVTRGPAGTRRRDLLLGDTPVLTTSRDVVRALELDDGQSGNADEIRARVCAEEPTWIKQRALHLLGYRERSHAELTRRLDDDGYDAHATERVLERLEDLGLLDDARFATSYVRTKLAAGWGRRRVADGLRSAGVAPDLIDATLGDESPDDERERAALLVDARRITSQASAQRAVARLVRRGFSYAVARDVVFAALAAADQESPQNGSC